MDTTNIMGWTLKELWNYVKTIEDDLENEDLVEIEKAKNGIEIEIPIHFFTKNYYEEHPEYLIVNIIGWKKVPMTQFHREIDAREKILRKIILELNDGDPIIQSRLN